MARLSRLPNAMLATWQTGFIPADFDVFRMRWETGHMIVAAFKLCGFVVLRLAIAGRSLNDGGADVVAMTDSQTYLPRATWIYRRGSSAGDDRRRSHRAREGARTSFAASRQSSQPPSGFNLLVGILDGNFLLGTSRPASGLSANNLNLWRSATMDGSNLPLHILERAERRWASVLSRQAAKPTVTKSAGTPSSPGDTRQSYESNPGKQTLKRPEWNRTP